MKTAPDNMLLPPYGGYNQMYGRYLKDNNVPPDDFLGDSPEAKLVNKEEFINGVIERVRRKFWPEWSIKKRRWIGHSAEQMIAFTKSDLQLLKTFRPKTNQNILLPSGGINRIHYAAFESEDSAVQYNEIDFYLSKKPMLTSGFNGKIENALKRKINCITLELKFKFQRPRPYQAAYILREDGLTFARGLRADTPSLIAGHCLQGLIGSATIHLEWLAREEYDDGAQQNFQQYATDFGDRRVFAGVHYPSDTLITWLICFELATKVFAPEDVPKVTSFLRASVERSHVWTHISTLRKQDLGCDTYRKLLADVRNLLARS